MTGRPIPRTRLGLMGSKGRRRPGGPSWQPAGWWLLEGGPKASQELASPGITAGAFGGPRTRLIHAYHPRTPGTPSWCTPFGPAAGRRRQPVQRQLEDTLPDRPLLQSYPQGSKWRGTLPGAAGPPGTTAHLTWQQTHVLCTRWSSSCCTWEQYGPRVADGSLPPGSVLDGARRDAPCRR